MKPILMIFSLVFSYRRNGLVGLWRMLLVNVIFDWCGWKNTANDDRRLWYWILNI